MRFKKSARIQKKSYKSLEYFHLILCKFFLSSLFFAIFFIPFSHAQRGLDNLKPFWVLERPIDEVYYIGIGAAPLRENPAESEDSALKNALNDIATQIEVNISSDITQKAIEKGGNVHEEYQTEIRTMVSANLEGIEIVGTWQDSKNYWVYIRLSRLEFERIRQEKIKKARQLAFSLFTQADTKERDSISSALSLYLQALKPLQAALSDPLEVSHRGQAYILSIEIPSRIQKILSSIKLEVLPIPFSLKQGTTLNTPLKVTAYLKENATLSKVKDLPIKLSFEKGKGELVTRAWTGQNGIAVSRLCKIQGTDNLQVVRAEIDLGAFFAQDTTELPIQRRLSEFVVPSAIFQLSVSKRLVYIVSRESNLSRPLPILHIEPLVKDSLEKYGLNFVEQPGRVDLVVEINADTRQGNRVQNIYFSYLDIAFSMKSRGSGNEVFKTALSNIKGAGATYEQAGTNAYEKATEEIKKNILPRFLEALNSNQQ